MSEGGRSQKSRHGISKTGGVIRLELKDDEIAKEVDYKHDDFNRIDLEIK